VAARRRGSGARGRSHRVPWEKMGVNATVVTQKYRSQTARGCNAMGHVCRGGVDKCAEMRGCRCECRRTRACVSECVFVHMVFVAFVCIGASLCRRPPHCRRRSLCWGVGVPWACVRAHELCEGWSLCMRARWGRNGPRDDHGSGGGERCGRCGRRRAPGCLPLNHPFVGHRPEGNPERAGGPSEALSRGRAR